VNEKPILFSGEMVKAILEGRKTQTRRALKKQPVDILPMKVPNMWATLRIKDEQNPDNNRGDIIGCRFGRAGDRLWVRETWRHSRAGVVYKADIPNEFQPHFSWKPSIFMPRSASRITLEIVSVRAERLQAISKEDARAEGMSNVFTWNPKAPNGARFSDGQYYPTVANFRRVWDSLNDKRGFGWDLNPYVWVIEFKKADL
jgi:hypothetical protein